MGVQDCANDLVKCAGSFGMIADAGTRIASIDVNPFLIDLPFPRWSFPLFIGTFNKFVNRNVGGFRPRF
jgi:hypothetical protein